MYLQNPLHYQTLLANLLRTLPRQLTQFLLPSRQQFVNALHCYQYQLEYDGTQVAA